MTKAKRKTAGAARVKNRRGSPEAIAKRRAGRAFNELLGEGSERLDGRREKRRQRLLAELESGTTRSGRSLKPLELVAHASELIGMGEDGKSLRKLAKKRRQAEPDPQLLALLGELQRAYGFHPEAFVVVGIEPDLLETRDARGRSKAAGAKPVERPDPPSGLARTGRPR
ncbi:MAG: hypothetical protein KF718_21190 [Polyangiaceae bacterium]|nr:hypothetical protein [Polyangiaceae bacterium]